ncbi:MAG: isoamylase early set domain-containing protein [Verrucomicrobia bacterium]|nr:isoamylase early set domain-containing protein [Verrucomicrobiota bacterium]
MDRGIEILGTKQGLTARKTVVTINFRCLAPQAKTVFLVGDFNDWQPQATPLRRHVDGSWSIHVALNHGNYRYQFLVDGRPTLDPRAHGVTRNEQNERVSLICVS